ncbi:MAG: hypothetical protein FVQ82_06900 [Planctomycetes bacterium]|nr:hypothetical protein [Planctomycetota bacterium]
MEPKQAQFIELRAAGQSYNKISVQLKVSKPTLIKWSRKFSNDIKNAKALEIESIREEYLLGREHQLRVLGTQLSKLTKEILKRNLKEIPTWRLFDMQRKIIAQIAKNDEQIEFSTEVEKYTPEATKEYRRKIINWTG